MALEETITKAMTAAMKSKDQVALRALRAIKAEILLVKTSASHTTLDDVTEIRLLQKMVKQRKESLAIYEEQGRDDLAQIEKEEIALIEQFLPAQMDENELRTFIADLITELGAEGMKDMGRVMGEANKRLAGSADGKTVAGIVKELLA